MYTKTFDPHEQKWFVRCPKNEIIADFHYEDDAIELLKHLNRE